MKNPLLSIIVPCYNAGAEIERCLLSLLQQSYANLELIVVDDASTDDSVQRVEGLKDERIKLIRHDRNRGASAARNTGLNVARGEYIGFVDGDDFVEVDYYERLYQAAAGVGADIVMAEMKIVFPKKTIVRQNSETVEHDFIKKWGMLHNGSPCDKLYKSEMIEKYGLRFYEGKIWEDNFFVLQALYASGVMTSVQGVAYHYIMHQCSTMHAPSLLQKRRDDSLFMAREMMAFVEKSQMTMEEKNAVVSFILQNMTPKHDYTDAAYYVALTDLLGGAAVSYMLTECKRLDGKLRRYKVRVQFLVVCVVVLVLVLLGFLVAWGG